MNTAKLLEVTSYHERTGSPTPKNAAFFGDPGARSAMPAGYAR
jgi:hypothetical protein